MLCRISLLLGRPPSEVRALPLSDLHMLTQYWSAEPWGPWRDNLHAGLIAAAVGNYSAKKLKRPLGWKDFLLRDPDEVQGENRGSLLAALRMISVPKTKPKTKPKAKG